MWRSRGTLRVQLMAGMGDAGCAGAACARSEKLTAASVTSLPPRRISKSSSPCFMASMPRILVACSGKPRLRQSRLRGLLYLSELPRRRVALPDHPQGVGVHGGIQPHAENQEQHAIERIGDHAAQEGPL